MYAFLFPSLFSLSSPLRSSFFSLFFTPSLSFFFYLLFFQHFFRFAYTTFFFFFFPLILLVFSLDMDTLLPCKGTSPLIYLVLSSIFFILCISFALSLFPLSPLSPLSPSHSVQHPEHQHKVREEMKEVLKGGQPSFEAVCGMPFTTAVLNETLRYPSFLPTSFSFFLPFFLSFSPSLFESLYIRCSSAVRREVFEREREDWRHHRSQRGMIYVFSLLIFFFLCLLFLLLSLF